MSHPVASRLILLTGATGYVGGRLLPGYQVCRMIWTIIPSMQATPTK